jgi:hypothetical protein
VQGGQTGEEQQTGANSATMQQALMTHWNDAVDAAGTTTDFHWTSYDQFPHPTYKMGTAEAYNDFAAVLLLFFRQSFDFLAQNHLFQAPLRYIFPSGQNGLDTNFQKLASDFSSNAGVSNLSDSDRQELKGYLDRM